MHEREKITDSYGAQIPNQLDAAYSTNLHFLLPTSLSIFSSSRQEEGIHRASALHQTRSEASPTFLSPSRVRALRVTPGQARACKIGHRVFLKLIEPMRAQQFFLDIKRII